MIRALKNLIGLAGREDATSAELKPSLPVAEAELVAAQEAQAAAENLYRSALLSVDDGALAKLDTARREARIRIERAEALVETLRERLDGAQEREAEARRVADYDAVRLQANAARQMLIAEYPRLADEVVRLIEAVALADMEVKRVNADLPDGAPPLNSVEHDVRDRPAEPDEILSETAVERWVAVGHLKPGSFAQDNVYITGPGRGVIRIAGVPVNECTQVELRKFTLREYRKGAPGQSAYRLAEKVMLPGLRFDDREHWRPMDAPSRVDEIARRAEALRFAAAPSPSRVTSSVAVQTRVDLIPARGAEKVLELPKPPSTTPYRGPFGSAED